MGFFVELLLPPGVQPLPACATGTLGTLHVRCPSVHSGLGFLVFLRDGCLSLLECFTYEEPLPALELSELEFEEFPRIELQRGRGS